MKTWILAHAAPAIPTPRNGKILYKTSTNGEWLETDVGASSGLSWGFDNADLKEAVVEIIFPSKDASGVDITGFESMAFANCSNLQKIVIPGTITSFSDDVFADCWNLGVEGVDGIVFIDRTLADAKNLMSSQPYLVGEPSGFAVCCKCGDSRFTAYYYSDPDNNYQESVTITDL